MTYLYNTIDEFLVKFSTDKRYFYWKNHAWLRSNNDLPMECEHLVPDSAVLLIGAPIYD